MYHTMAVRTIDTVLESKHVVQKSVNYLMQQVHSILTVNNSMYCANKRTR